MRANLMAYRTMDDPWLRRMRQTPEQTIGELMPNLRGLTGDFKVEDTIRIRPADLYVTHGHRQSGIVLASEGMSAAKISQFYDEPEKCANDAQSLREAFDLRSMSIDTGLMWHARRWGSCAASAAPWRRGGSRLTDER